MGRNKLQSKPKVCRGRLKTPKSGLGAVPPEKFNVQLEQPRRTTLLKEQKTDT